MIPTKDIAWLAGLLEGEGCFTWQPHSHNRQHGAIRITLSLCDLDVVERAAALTRSNVHEFVHNGRDGHTRKKQYRIQVGGRRAAAWMMTLFPLMGQRRQARIAEILDQWKRPVSERTPDFGHKHNAVAAPKAA